MLMSDPDYAQPAPARAPAGADAVSLRVSCRRRFQTSEMEGARGRTEGTRGEGRGKGARGEGRGTGERGQGPGTRDQGVGDGVTRSGWSLMKRAQAAIISSLDNR